MALPITFANVAGGSEALALLDTQFAAVAAMGVIPCTATGVNSITLTPNPNTPTINAYTDLAPSFIFAAVGTSNGNVQIQYAALGLRQAYKWNGTVAAGAGDLVNGGVYAATFLTALNAGSGGFVVNPIGVQNNIADIEFVIGDGTSVLTLGTKGSLRIPWGGTINTWSLMADQSSSVTVDILRANNAVPITSMIGAGTKPALSAAQFAAPTAPSAWTSNAFVANDWITFSLTGSAPVNVTRLTVDLSMTKS
jgi:hypothetical protein